jgi:AcrR family transcriptional regulator
MSDQPRNPAQREQIIEATLAILETEGPVNFRLQALADRLGITIPALYRHFKDRNDIIRSAYVESFTRETEAAAALTQYLTEVEFSGETLLHLMVEQLSQLNSVNYKRQRLTRMEALATTTQDEESKKLVTDLLHKMHISATAAYGSWQQRGVFRHEFNPAAFSIVSRSLLAGLIVWDMDESLDVPVEDVRQVIEHILRQFIIV